MSNVAALYQLIGVVLGVIVFTVLIVTNKVTSDVGVPIITGLVGSLTAPAVSVAKNTANAK